MIILNISFDNLYIVNTLVVTIRLFISFKIIYYFKEKSSLWTINYVYKHVLINEIVRKI